MNFPTDAVQQLADKAEQAELQHDDPIAEFLRGLVSERDQLLGAIKAIAAMVDPDDMETDDNGLTEWGCEINDAVHMSYENCITIAQLALGEVTLP